MDKDKYDNIIKFDRRIKMNTIVEREPKTLDCLLHARSIIQKTIKDKGLTENEVRKSFGIKRYEK
jgi:hypothetical protein